MSTEKDLTPSKLADELLKVADFIYKTKPSEHIIEMNEKLYKAVGYSQWVGARMNEAEYNYAVNREQNLAKLADMENETETTRKSKLDSWSAADKKLVQDLKNIKNNLRAIQMSLMQSIRSRREEMQMGGRS